MNKKNLLALAASALLLVQTTLLPMAGPSHGGLAARLTPQDVELIFDIDDVFLHRAKLAPQLWQHSGTMAWSAMSPTLLWGSAKKWWGGNASGEEWKAYFRENAPDMAKVVQQIAHNKTPIPGTVKIIEALEHAGYRLHIASNMGAGDFEYFKTTKYPHIFKNFENDTAKVVAFLEGEKIKKPNEQYFKDLFAKYKGNKDKLLIFMDDKPKNVAAFVKVGKELGFNVKGIQFTSPEQLKEDLTKLGVALPVGLAVLVYQ